MPATMTDSETDTTTQVVQQTRRMPMYKVLIHNDAKSTQEFVTKILMSIFGHDPKSAIQIMLEVHEKGVGLAGIYALEHAEMKRDMAVSLARTQKFPLQLSIEPDE